MNIFEKLSELANKIDERGLHNEASMIDDMIQKVSAPPAGNVELGQPSVSGRMSDVYRELGLPQGASNKDFMAALKSKYPSVWKAVIRGYRNRIPPTAQSLLAQIQQQKQYDFAGKSPWGQEGMAFEVGPKGFDFKGQLPPGQEGMAFEVGPNEYDFEGKLPPGQEGMAFEVGPGRGVSKKTKQTTPVGQRRGGEAGEMQSLPQDWSQIKMQEANMKNIIEKLSEVADSLDKKGMHDEAGEIDEIMKKAVEVEPFSMVPEEFSMVPEEEGKTSEVWGPGSQGLAGLPKVPGTKVGPNKVEKWQRRYNRVLKGIQQEFGALPEGMNFLKPDGIKGRNTRAAMQSVKGFGNLRAFKDAMKQQMVASSVAARSQQNQQVQEGHLTEAIEKLVQAYEDKYTPGQPAPANIKQQIDTQLRSLTDPRSGMDLATAMQHLSEQMGL